MRATGGFLVWLVLASGAAGAAPATEKLAVLPILLPGTHGDASISSVIDDVATAAAFRHGIKLVSSDQLAIATSGELAERVRECGSDNSCMADRLRAFDARFGLVVLVNLSLDPPLIGLQLLDTDERKLVGENLGELAKAEGTVSSAIRARARQLFDRAGYALAGRLVIDVVPAQAKVSVTGGVVADEGAPNAFTVLPGRYEIQGELDGYKSNKAAAVAIAGQETRVGLALEPEGSVFSSAWLWLAIGAVAAGGATAAILATRSTSRCVCVVIDGVGCEICKQ